jgi:hypothetical protein
VHQIESLGKGCHIMVILSMLARKQATQFSTKET